jgi:hypothetical protein
VFRPKLGEAYRAERRNDVLLDVVLVRVERRAGDRVGDRYEPLREILLDGYPIVSRRDALAQFFGLFREPFRGLAVSHDQWERLKAVCNPFYVSKSQA